MFSQSSSQKNPPLHLTAALDEALEIIEPTDRWTPFILRRRLLDREVRVLRVKLAHPDASPKRLHELSCVKHTTVAGVIRRRHFLLALEEAKKWK